MKKINTKSGDILKIPVTDDRFVYSQIISCDRYFGLIVFKGLLKDNEPFSSKEIDMLFTTSDQWVHDRKWEIVSNEKLPKNLHLPNYKIGLREVYLVDFFGKTIKKASDDEKDIYEYRSTPNLQLVQTAIRSRYGFDHWDASFDRLLYKPVENNG